MDNDSLAASFAALFIGLFGKLRGRGLLNDVDIRDIFENATLGLEEMGLDANDTARKAHTLLSDLQWIVERHGHPPGA